MPISFQTDKAITTLRSQPLPNDDNQLCRQKLLEYFVYCQPERQKPMIPDYCWASLASVYIR